MTTPALTSQGILFKIASGAGSAKTVTGVAVGFPTILTSAAHGFSNGDRVTFDSNFAGANASTLNAQVVNVTNVTTNTYAVQINTVGLTITAGTATGTAATYTNVGGVSGISDFESGETPEIDVSDFDSTFKEYIAGLADNGAFTMAVNFAKSQAGQTIVQARRDDGVVSSMKVVLPAGSTPTASFTGFVKKFSKNMAVGAAQTGQISIRVTGAVTWA